MIIGAVLTGIGALLLAYGAYLKGEEQNVDSTTKAQQQYKDLATRIDSLKDTPAGPDKDKRVEALGQDFEQWAKELTNRLESAKLRQQRDGLDLEMKQREKTQMWGGTYKNVVSLLQSAINAASSNSKDKFAAKIPPVPDNIFLNYSAEVRFPNKVRLMVVWIGPTYGSLDLPQLLIKFFTEPQYIGSLSDDRIRMSPSEKSKEFNLFFEGKASHLAGQVPSTIPYTGNDKELNALIKAAVELAMVLM